MIKFYQVREISDAWRQANAQAQHHSDERITRYTSALAAEYTNGSVMCVSIDLTLSEEVFALADHHENWKYSQLLERLWDVDAVTAQLPGTHNHSGDAIKHFQRADCFELTSFLASALFNGGAYSRQTRSVSGCFELAVPCMEALTEGGLCAVLLANTAWCEFFFDVAWDRSVVIANARRKQVNVLLATDTD